MEQYARNSCRGRPPGKNHKRPEEALCEHVVPQRTIQRHYLSGHIPEKVPAGIVTGQDNKPKNMRKILFNDMASVPAQKQTGYGKGRLPAVSSGQKETYVMF